MFGSPIILKGENSHCPQSPGEVEEELLSVTVPTKKFAVDDIQVVWQSSEVAKCYSNGTGECAPEMEDSRQRKKKKKKKRKRKITEEEDEPVINLQEFPDALKPTETLEVDPLDINIVSNVCANPDKPIEPQPPPSTKTKRLVNCDRLMKKLINDLVDRGQDPRTTHKFHWSLYKCLLRNHSQAHSDKWIIYDDLARQSWEQEVRWPVKDEDEDSKYCETAKDVPYPKRWKKKSKRLLKDGEKVRAFLEGLVARFVEEFRGTGVDVEARRRFLEGYVNKVDMEVVDDDMFDPFWRRLVSETGNKLVREKPVVVEGEEDKLGNGEGIVRSAGKRVVKPPVLFQPDVFITSQNRSNNLAWKWHLRKREEEMNRLREARKERKMLRQTKKLRKMLKEAENLRERLKEAKKERKMLREEKKARRGARRERKMLREARKKEKDLKRKANEQDSMSQDLLEGEPVVIMKVEVKEEGIQLY